MWMEINYFMSSKILALHNKTKDNSHIHKWFCDCHPMKLRTECVSWGAKLIETLASLQQRESLTVTFLQQNMMVIPLSRMERKEE